jgi:CspA family cold shock protein
MTMLQNRIDVPAEINACEFIRAFDESRLDLELRKAGLDPEGLPLRLEALLGVTLQITACSDAAAYLPASAEVGIAQVHAPHATPGTQLVATAANLAACAPIAGLFELAGTVKFFDASKGYGFFTADGEPADIMVHVTCLEAAGYRTTYDGARIHALVRRTTRGLQAVRIISMDQSSATHPSQLPQRTRQKVCAESDWVKAAVKWYDRLKGFGFVSEGPDAPDCFVHADTLRRWGLAPLRPGQVVEMRWGMSGRGRMVAEIRYSGGQQQVPMH